MRLASHLKMSLDEVKMKTSASQLILWMEYLKHEMNDADRYCYYMAQIAMEVRSLISRGKRLKIEDFLIPFKFKEEQGASEIIDRQKQLLDDKRFFFGLTGLTGSGVRKKKGK